METEAAGTGRFHPFAAYDVDMDRIIVIVRDGDYIEVFNPPTPLICLQDVHGKGRVGFVIEYAYLFCANCRLLRNDQVSLHETLNAIAKRFPASDLECSIAHEMLKTHNLASVMMKK